MLEKDVGEYIDKVVKKFVSKLNGNGEKVKEDIAYTILMGLGSKYSPLVLTLLNNRSGPLTLTRIVDAIITKDMRLKELDNDAGKRDPNTINPLATPYRSNTSFNSLVGTSRS